jgi:DNA primase
MTSSSVEQIKSKLDIVTVIGAYVKLEKAGANFKGKCPFHNEKTPSFFVSPDRGSYYCFGCQAKGDIFTFVEEFEGLDFIGALKVLAERAGVELERFDHGEKSEKEKLFSILEQATFFFQKNLSENKSAQLYLVKRGISEETIKTFRIGFAPDEWRSLHDFLISKGVSEKDMLAVGLIKISAREKDTESREDELNAPATSASGRYDTFRGRIMFPISDSSGRVVGFSGRILVADDKAPKYLNSPETELFRKSEILFGLDKAKKEIRLKDYSILVEGQMDLVMMHQIGITNTVASSGTALSIEHLTKLRRLSSRIIMAYDGDSAGFSASDRSAKMALSLGMDLKIAQMPEGKDPADLAVENPQELREILKNSKHVIDFLTDALLEKKLDGRKLGKEIQTRVLPYVVLLSSNIEKSQFIKTIARKTFIKEEALWQDLTVPLPMLPSIETPFAEIVSLGRLDQIEKHIVGILLWQKSAGKPVIVASETEKKFIDIVGDSGYAMLDRAKDEKEGLIFEAESYYAAKPDISAEVEDLLAGLEEEYLKNKLSEIMDSMNKAKRDGDNPAAQKYFEEFQNISQQIDTIKKKFKK